MSDAEGVVCQNLCDGCLARVFGAQNEDSGGFSNGVLIVVGRRGSVEVAEGADTHLFEGEVDVCISGHGGLVRDILCGGTAGDVHGG